MTTQTIGVIGLGLLGRGIVACLLGHGHRVVAVERSEAARKAARPHIAVALKELVDRAGFSKRLRREWPRRYSDSSAVAALAGCDFVIESITENIRAKNRVYDEIEAVVGRRVPIASNTSAIPISKLQGSRVRPERFVGMHWSEPAHATRFLEIVRGDKTNTATFCAAEALALSVGKEPSLVRKDIRGFITNRLCYAMFREALHLLEAGVADVETIDRSFRNDVGWWATIAGPFRWMDMTGLPAYAEVMKELNPELDNTKQVPVAMRRLMKQHAQGFKNGRGFYRYTPREAKRWEKIWYDATWEIRKLAEKHTPVRRGGSRITPRGMAKRG